MGRGLYITDVMGMHTANPISGEFSLGVSGLWIEGGSVQCPVKEAVISGNILDLFRKVSSVGSDLRFYGNAGSPSLLIAPIDISA
jgi:PmbA protein